jgi:penicillin-binding protein A
MANEEGGVRSRRHRLHRDGSGDQFVNRQIRRLALGLLLCYTVLFVQLNVLQVGKAKRYKNRPDNTREVIRDFSRARGTVYSAENDVIAESVPSDDRYEFQRSYPLGDLFAHPVGSFSLKYGTSELETAYNDVLTGRTSQQKLRGLGNLFSTKVNTGDVYLTLSTKLQQAAKDALVDGQGRPLEGAVVVLDPKTGALKALWSNPSYDPNALATHDLKAADDYRALLLLDSRKPLLANTYQERYMPGSTFKVLTTTAGLEYGKLQLTDTFPIEKSWTPPLTTTPIQNYGGELCGGDLRRVFTISCNIPFAQTALKVGANDMIEAINAFGFSEPAPLEVAGAVPSYFGTAADFERNDPRLAQQGFGQNATQATPLHMALVAAAVANNGTIMTPYLVAETRDSGGGVLSRREPSVWKKPMTANTAGILRDFMVEVVNNGTARCCMKLESGIQAAVKTGTAQLRGPTEQGGPSSHAWIIGFAPADNPQYAFAVFVKANTDVTSGVGGTIAGPVAKKVMDAALTA